MLSLITLVAYGILQATIALGITTLVVVAVAACYEALPRTRRKRAVAARLAAYCERDTNALLLRLADDGLPYEQVERYWDHSSEAPLPQRSLATRLVSGTGFTRWTRQP